MNADIVDFARETAVDAAATIRSHGATPQPVDAVIITAILFGQLEAHAHISADLDARARTFSALLVVIEMAMLGTPEA